MYFRTLTRRLRRFSTNMPRFSLLDNPVLHSLQNKTKTAKTTRKRARTSDHDSMTGKRSKTVANREIVTFSTISEEFQIQPLQVYLQNLQESKMHFEVFGGLEYVLADCDTKGNMLKSFVCVHRRKKFTDDNGDSCVILTCDCVHGTVNVNRLSTMSTSLDGGDLSHFSSSEEARYCVHCQAVGHLYPYPATQDTASEFQQQDISLLQDNPLLVAVSVNNDINLVTYAKTKRQLKCSTCRFGSSTCEHAETVRAWLADHDTGPKEGYDEPPTSHFKSISYKPVPYPLTEELKMTFTEFENGDKTYEPYLIPQVVSHFPSCSNSYNWDPSDPVEKGWIIGSATIYKETCSICHTWDGYEKVPIKVCYRLCSGPCQCKMFYDGQDDLLFNLNNKDLIHYGLLLNYLHHMVEGRSPLAAYHRAFTRNHAVLSDCEPIPLPKLRLAWNSFARLLDIDYQNLFQCPICGPTPGTIICDATCLGVRKQYLKPYIVTHEELPGESVQGSSFTERTFLLNKKTRAALLQYSTCTSPLSEDVFNSMINLLRMERHGKLLAAFIQLVDDGHQPPDFTRQFLKDVSRPSPVCALLQTNDIDRAVSFLQQIGSGLISVSRIEELKTHSPVIGTWLSSVSKRLKPLPSCVYDLLLLVARLTLKTYDSTCQTDHTHTHASTLIASHADQLSYFPSLPKLHRDGTYAKDERKIPSDSCRKFCGKHPALSPGIFTIFCRHGVCYGFELLTSSESPKHPFSILKTRFQEPPNLIVYDNACKLHEYCLNREPIFFKNTIFCVDRMHWKNHVGCSSGYNLDTYQGRQDITSINSQVNEQANAALGRLKSHLSYMLPDNFMFHTRLFLAIQNKDKRDRIR